MCTPDALFTFQHKPPISIMSNFTRKWRFDVCRQIALQITPESDKIWLFFFCFYISLRWFWCMYHIN